MGEALGFSSGSSFGIDTDSIFSTACACERATVLVLGHKFVNLALDLDWGSKLALCSTLNGSELVAISYLNTNKTVGQIGVCVKPLGAGVRLVSEDDFNKQHVRESVTNGLVDELSKGNESAKGVSLSGRLWLMSMDGLQSRRGEDDGSVAVGLEVNTNIEASCRVVKMLDAGRSENKLQAKMFLNIAGCGTVGISRLDNTNVELLNETRLTGKVTNEGCCECSNAVTVQETEDIVLIIEVEDNAISIAIQRTAPVKRGRLGGRGTTLVGLYVIGTALLHVSIEQVVLVQ